jgi:integrase
MPRRSKGARLYRDPVRDVWVIRDGTTFVRTGTADRDQAEKALASYIGRKHEPQPSSDPLIDDVLAVYGRERAPHLFSGGRDVAYSIPALLNHWSGKRTSAITARACRAYKNDGGRRELSVLQAAIKFWHKEYGPLTSVPVVTLPPRGPARERWLTKSEAARFLWEARRTEHLKRFILIGLHTGSRAGVIFALRWDWIDFERGVMRRRSAEDVEKATKRRPPVRVSRRLLSFLRRWKEVDGAAPDGYVVHVRGDASHVSESRGNACARRRVCQGSLPMYSGTLAHPG